MIEKYYEEELRYLYESGCEFARAHPDRARFLNIDSVGDRDPYIERLFEGFAFLAGRIRERLADGFPRLIEGVVNLLWPQLLQQIPALSIVQFSARSGLLQQSITLPRHSEVISTPVGPESTACRFTTTQTVALHPMTMIGLDRRTTGRGEEVLTFRFEPEQTVKWENFSLQSLRLFLHAEPPTAVMLHRVLTTDVTHAHIGINGGERTFDLTPSTAVTPGGLSADESLLPENSRAFNGFSILREYFIFPDKFLFVDLNGFAALTVLEETPRTIEYTVTLGSEADADKPFDRSAFKLYCSPVVNLSRGEIDPFIRTGTRSSYRLSADSSHPTTTQVHSVTSVTGIERASGRRTSYEPVFAFASIGNRALPAYGTTYRRNAFGSRDLHLFFNDSSMEEGTLREEHISVQAWSSNGELPRDSIREGDITRQGKDFPEFVRITNITRPTLPYEPPDSSEYLWMFQSFLAAGWASIARSDTLRTVMRLYDWSGHEGRRRRVEAITDASSEPCERIIGGAVARGVRFILTLTEGAFEDTGDVHLFGLVLYEFLGHYVSINSFLELHIVLKPSGRLLTWQPTEGVKCLI